MGPNLWSRKGLRQFLPGIITPPSLISGDACFAWQLDQDYVLFAWGLGFRRFLRPVEVWDLPVMDLEVGDYMLLLPTYGLFAAVCDDSPTHTWSRLWS